MLKRNVLLLKAAVVLFTLSAAFNWYSLNRTANLVSQYLPQNIWSLTQLELEYANYLNQLKLYRVDATDHDSVILAYEIFWNRLNVLRATNEVAGIRPPGDGENTLSALLQLVADTEQLHMQLPPGDSRTLQELIVRFSGYQPAIRRLALHNYTDRQQLFGLDAIAGALKHFSLYLLGLLLSGGILIALLVRESRRNRHQARHDSLTGLPNRAHFVQQLNQSLARAKRENQQLAVLLIDLDAFKEVNDSMGHSAGDDLLRTVAKRLRRCTRTYDIAARLGGDEFAVIQYPVANHAEVTTLTERLLVELNRSAELKDGRCDPSASIGISLYPTDSDSAEQLLINADMAMYQAKQKAQMSYEFYETDLHLQQLRRKQIYHALRTLLSSRPEAQLMLHYQPICDLQSGTPRYAEALLRWQHPELGWISPLEIIAVAEHYGLAQPLGTWVLRTACRQLAQWRALGFSDFQVSVNVSPSMYGSGQLGETVAAVLAEVKLEPDCLMLEVTEDTTMQDVGEMAILHQLRAQGISVALDDFGTGHSSLSHLTHMPVQVLKIDRSFIQAWQQQASDLSVLRAIVQLGKSLGLKVIAEGIESAEDLRLLQREQCEYGQGYYLARPMPADQLTEFLQAATRQPVDA